jgi:FMN phosphatase YigB (HAD superfamily)
MEFEKSLKIWKEQIESKKVVSFDFDGTLTDEGPNDIAQDRAVDTGLNVKIYRLFKKHQARGHKVIVVTSRRGDYDNREDVKDFCRHFRLKPEGMYFTDGDYKVNTLLSLGVDLHYDNDAEEIAMIQKHGKGQVKGVLV